MPSAELLVAPDAVLDALEAEAIHVFREAAGAFRRPVMLYSIGKDSSVLLRLAVKAFAPGKVPFPVLHIDTTWKFREMIAFRDRTARELGLDLVVHTNKAGVDEGVTPFTHGAHEYTRIMKTVALREALDQGGYDAAFGGARRDEERSRAKERVFSLREPGHRWEPRKQRPEFWRTANTELAEGQTMRVFPMSNWTELDVWRYVQREQIPVVPLYFAKPRPTVERDGQLIMVDDDRFPLQNGEKPQLRDVRFRTLGCYPLTAAVESTADNMEDLLTEMLTDRRSERAGRLIDGEGGGSMESKKTEGVLLMTAPVLTEVAQQALVEHPIVRIVACGSVDDGKSTLIGRLLAETDSVPDDILEYARNTRRSGSTIAKGEVDFSMLTDGLEAEHEQGITIDVAYRHLYLPSGRRAIIADAPGHEQYTRNMAVAASTADIAILLVDAFRGIRPQTHRHLTVCAIMGVRTVVVAINKMDAVGFEHVKFEEFAGEVRAAAARFDLDQVHVIPVSALTGDNVMAPSTQMPWYHGPTVLESLISWLPAQTADEKAAPFRMPVQYVARADDFRGYAGTVVAGSVRPGDQVVVNARGSATTVERVLAVGGTDVDEAVAGQAVTLTLETEVDITRGDLLVAPPNGPTDEHFPRPATAYAADLVWTGEEELRHGRSYLLLAGSLSVPAVVTAIRGRRDVVTGEEMAGRTLKMNDIGHVEIATDTAVPLDPYPLSRDTGGFLLVERVSRDTVAAGLVRHALRRAHNVVPHAFTVDRKARAKLKAQHPRVLWLTGLPGAGKSTIADALERRLHGMGMHTYVLDGDGVRTGLNKDLGFTPEDRAENVRRVAETAKLMMDAGLVVIVSLVSPFRGDRRAAKSLFDEGEFVEVWVDTPADVVVQRDPKGLYAKAKAGTLPNMTGVGQMYEPPEHPDLVVSGAGDVEESVALLLEALEVVH